MGVSMGAATVTMALGFDLPKAVKGCIADCGFTSPEEIFKYVLGGLSPSCLSIYLYSKVCL